MERTPMQKNDININSFSVYQLPHAYSFCRSQRNVRTCTPTRSTEGSDDL